MSETFMLFGAFATIFRIRARQLADDRYVVQWFAMGVTPTAASAWANAGYTPTEAAVAMTAGLTLREA